MNECRDMRPLCSSWFSFVYSSFFCTTLLLKQTRNAMQLCVYSLSLSLSLCLSLSVSLSLSLSLSLCVCVCLSLSLYLCVCVASCIAPSLGLLNFSLIENLLWVLEGVAAVIKVQLRLPSCSAYLAPVIRYHASNLPTSSLLAFLPPSPP
jgi:hypothetical protein